MHRRHILFNVLFIVFSIGVAAFEARLQAQAISGDLVGRVTDASGAIVPNVSVTVTNTATDVKASASTNAGGVYRISNLLPGNYDVSAAAPGFSTFKLRNVPVQPLPPEFARTHVKLEDPESDGSGRWYRWSH